MVGGNEGERHQTVPASICKEKHLARSLSRAGGEEQGCGCEQGEGEQRRAAEDGRERGRRRDTR